MNVLKSKLVSLPVALVLAATLTFSAQVSAVKPSERYTLVQLAIDANQSLGVFNQLYGALVAENELLGDESLIARLSGNGQYAVFAPLDSAFEDLEINVLPNYCYYTVGELLEDQPGYVSDVLNYHVAKGRKDSGEVLPADQIRMLTGDFVTREPGSLEIVDTLERTAMLQPPFIDLPADNGVIHVIDKVILPYAPASNCAAE